jgi:hypothetical protein
MAKPFFRHKGSAALAAFIDAGAAHRNTIHRDSPGMRRQFFAAERCKKLILTIAGDTCDAEHLTRAKLKIYIGKRNTMGMQRRER